MSAGGVLSDAVLAALRGIEGLSGAFDGPPVRAGDLHAVVDAGLESDWSHKSGEGREVRLAVTVHGKGESPARTRAAVEAGQAAVSGLGAELEGWRVVSLVFLRARLLREPGDRWAGVSEYRVRMLRGA